MSTPSIVHLQAGGCSLVVDCRGRHLPRVLHWGRGLGELSEQDLEAFAFATLPQVASNTMDDPVPVSVMPEQSLGWLGTPGLSAHRDGADFSALFTVTRVAFEGAAGGTQRLVVEAADEFEWLGLVLEVEMTSSGLVRQRAKVVNHGEQPLTVDGVLLALPVPAHATEVLDLTGRHLRERSPQRHELTLGTHLRENRRGRAGTDASTIVAAGELGFGFRSGQVWCIHVAWSGNHRALAEATPSGARFLGGGELLLPGEVRLAQGETYQSPWLYASYGDGLDQVAERIHRFLRARPNHPRTERPVTLNTWEAVYFDLDPEGLKEMATTAASVGVERFVLDDGWFRGRNHDRAGLGDWYVDEEVWPDGLHPLADHVRMLGMEFGLWVEPEMVNPDSDLFRAHPEWVMGIGERLPPLSRYQQVLNVSHPRAYAYLLERLDSLLSEYPIGYLKWDHNRDLVDAGDRTTRRARVREQTLAVYRLMDELRARHPGVEIESCSSGGGRVDLAVIERTDRVWASDCIDPLERQQIQRWTGVLLPPEMIGSHIGAPTSHTTGRTHSLDFRAATALFGHLGIEWDLATADKAERKRLRRWVRAYKELRGFLHSGTVVHGDDPDPALWVHGVVAQDRSRAIYAFVQTETSVHSPPGMMRLPGLDPESTYHLSRLRPGNVIEGPALTRLPWWSQDVTLPGRILKEVGVQAPMLYPERSALLEVVRVDR